MTPLKIEKLELANQKVFFKSSENMEEVPTESVTLIVTSPPYWNVRDYGGKQIGFGQSYSAYIESLNKVWSECIRVLQPNGKFAVNVQPLPIESSQSGFGRRIIQNIMFDIEKFMRENGLFLSGMHYWDKSEYVSNVSWGSYPKPTNIASNTGFEQIFIWVKPGKTRKVDRVHQEKSLLKKNEWRHWAVRCIWDDIAPVIKIDSKGKNRFGHSAPFPESIPYRLIRMHTVIGETVLDPFLGSGTTLKICRLTSRKGIGYEINSEYSDLIQNRILEDWKFPIIQAQYKIFGTNDFYDILNFIIGRVKEDSTLELKTVLKGLQKEFPDKITKSWFNHLVKLSMKEKFVDNQKMVLNDFLNI
ncbi:MAG: DNA-methyltransferase [Candidatus Hodarchaeota archaeon]